GSVRHHMHAADAPVADHGDVQRFHKHLLGDSGGLIGKGEPQMDTDERRLNSKNTDSHSFFRQKCG
ncbi:MAG: hypothetical protein KDD83_29920, partial [Caldilineaceae bacterium]|nr:hypothetical protein [Caldilineaceae bacterium]